jgi:hypothetical protein
MKIGDDEHGSRMLVESIRHLVEAEAHVLQADFLGDDEERRRREGVVDAAHEARQHRRVAHAGVEDADRGRRGLQIAQLVRRASRRPTSRCRC